MRLYDGDVIITRPLWCNQWNNATTIHYMFDISDLADKYEVKILFRPVINHIKASKDFFIDSAKFICKKVHSFIYRKHDFHTSN